MNYVIYFIGCIFLISLSVGTLVKNILALRYALIFYHDFNNKKIITAKAVITELRHSVNSRGCTASARAKYDILGEQIIGKMICRYDYRLKSEQSVKIVVSGTKRDIFAVNDVLYAGKKDDLYAAKEQVKNAVLTYSVFCVLSLALVIGIVILSILTFPKPL